MQLRPEDSTSDNEFEAMLKYGQIDMNRVHRLRIEKTGIPEELKLDDYCAVIVGGSPFDISTPETEKSSIQKKIERDFSVFLDEVTEKDFPFLGACSGNGLLGSYLGTSISGQYNEAVGSAELTITEEGKNDPLLQGFPDKIKVLLGHKEACDTVPQGATLLMTGECCPVQMFRVGENVYATQFHPEGDSEGFIVRVNVYKHHGYFEPHEAEELIIRLEEEDTPYAQKILQRFVERYS
jgi:GMP synthase (glutamine-hydrolysing)